MTYTWSGFSGREHGRRDGQTGSQSHLKENHLCNIAWVKTTCNGDAILIIVTLTDFLVTLRMRLHRIPDSKTQHARLIFSQLFSSFLCLVLVSWHMCGQISYFISIIPATPPIPRHFYFEFQMGIHIPDSKVHGANMGPTWVLSAPDGPMLAPWTLLSGMITTWCYSLHLTSCPSTNADEPLHTHGVGHGSQSSIRKLLGLFKAILAT